MTTARPVLSICIPCRRRWHEVIKFVAEAAIQDLPRGRVEVCVSLSGVSEIPKELSELESSGVRTSLTGEGVAFGDNLRWAVGMAQGQWCLTMGDDDRLSSSALRRLVDELQEIPPGSRFASLHVAGWPARKTMPRRSVAMRCGSMSGLLFQPTRLLQELRRAEADLPGAIYPQIWAGMAATHAGASPILSAEVRFGGGHADLAKAFSDHMNRPADFGVGERIHWAIKGRREGLLNRVEFHLLVLNIFIWSQTIARSLADAKEERLAAKFRAEVRTVGAVQLGKLRTHVCIWLATVVRLALTSASRRQDPQRD